MSRKNAKMFPVSASPAPSERAAPMACGGCGCTDEKACPGGCEWIQPRLCSVCAADLHPLIVYQILFGHQLAMLELGRQARRLKALIQAKQIRDSWDVVKEDLVMLMHDLISHAGRLARVNESVVPE